MGICQVVTFKSLLRIAKVSLSISSSCSEEKNHQQIILEFLCIMHKSNDFK